ncbi:MAG: formimidoylglutamase [Sphingobacteriaceae bacterium]
MAGYMSKLDIYTPADLADMTLVREGETKLGQQMSTVSDLEALKAHPAKFVLIGLPEDIGVRANGGKAGAAGTWAPSLKALCNIQCTEKLLGESLLVLGHLDFTEEMVNSQVADTEGLRSLVRDIDEGVFSLLLQIFESGKTPLVIGGGHNNAYPILKALSTHRKKGINVINIDAHADFRALEGRHSGNGFSYAFADGFLDKYAICGLHENYNSQYIIDQLNAHPDRISYTFFEDFLRAKSDVNIAFRQALNFTSGTTGLEIDLDSMAGVSASAGSLSGFGAEQVRSMIYQAKGTPLAYLHICEGIAETQPLLPRLISYLISDFVKAQS